MEAKRAKTAAISKAKPVSKTNRAKLIFPVGRIHRILRNGNFAPRIGSGASVYLTAVLEYLCAEVIELSAKAASDNKKNRISPRFILLAIRNDDELNNLLSGAVISSGGTIPKIHPVLLPKKTMKKTAKDTSEADVSSQEY